MKMYEVLEVLDFCRQNKDKKLPLKTAYKMNKLIDALEKEGAFYQEQLNNIIATFGQKDESGNLVYTEAKDSIKVIDGKQEECNRAINELRELEVAPISITFSLDELEELEFSISELRTLMPFIED